MLAAVAALVASWLTVIGGAAAAPATAEQAASPLAAVPTGAYEIHPRGNRDSCLRAGPQIDPRPGDTAVCLGSCNGGHAEWFFEPTRTTGAGA